MKIQFNNIDLIIIDNKTRFIVNFVNMLSLKQSKSRSISRGIGKIDLDSNMYLQKTISTQSK